MENRELVKHLVSLAHLDIDAIHAYDQAIEKIEENEIRQQLTLFKSDHERHVRDLSEHIVKNGGKAPEFKPDFKGFVIQGFTAMRSMSGTDGALKAMKSNEKLTNKNYDDALKLDFPTDVMDLVRRNRDDERRHLEYIERTLAGRTGEQGAKAA